ncbi:hypothetical protein JCM21714_1141 [Gracilibacillus boraciitolerans JCM 21714]|uniref:LarC family nickel insertion protein n=1 Tax=Gracilibacillus boraciitolerans JCM 21714 TaxID=1298598 RepID=W4VHC2_9BACI|nr:hypothetical protein JCM21714_1141 [Gracilibacillus boraciitolerans JCM 21714]
MRKVLYFDCFSGISGDMTIAALLDTGISLEWLESQLLKLHVEQKYELKLNKVIKNGINSNHFDVIFEEASDHHDHKHETDHHTHHHRTYKDIVQMIENSELNESVKTMALDMFRVIGEAEAKIHGIDLDHVHFHEVGAIDSIIDIVGVAILIDHLGIDQIISSPVPVGSGHIHIDHGIYPVPAPATLEILKDIPIKNTKVVGGNDNTNRCSYY